MIQTTLFSYFNCNGSIQPTVNKVHSFKQTNLTDYFNIIPKKKKIPIELKKDSILNYFKPKEENKEFNLVLVDLLDLSGSGIQIYCVKKNMYDPDLKYIAISYRWGELGEQSVKTPDYTTYITSFHFWYMRILYTRIKNEPDLKEIPYLWIDVISIDQQNQLKKKETILKMSEIYKRATYILAVPDLHEIYLWKNPLNKDIINLMRRYDKTIYEEIYYYQQHQHQRHHHSLINKIKNRIKGNEEIKKVYQFLAYLIDDWSNRVWVISEYQIAKEKYKQHGTPLKYTFISLSKSEQPFFSFNFDGDDDQQQHTIKDEKSDKNNKVLTYEQVDDPKKFNQFVKERFKQRSHLEMILNSNATRNEDRFNAILPLWDKYKHKIRNKHTISQWNITDMTSVRLKLYEIMDDLWDRATLLYACSRYEPKHNILPTFASHHNIEYLELVEKDNINIAYERYEKSLLKDIQNGEVENEENEKETDNCIKQLIHEYKMKSKPIWTENLTSIQLNRHCLSVKSNLYFIKELDEINKEYHLSAFSLFEKDVDRLHYVYIPFFTIIISGYIDIPPSFKCTGIRLIGDMDKNRWVLVINEYEVEHSCSKNYTFNIY